jgi:HD-like signal output (HDOD) protein
MTEDKTSDAPGALPTGTSSAVGDAVNGTTSGLQDSLTSSLPVDPSTDPSVDPAPATALSPEELAAKEAQEAAEREAAEREAALNRLMQRINKNTNFPSLKESIRSIQKIARSDTIHRRAFSDQVLNDVALTAKLLRLINAAYYSSVGAGSITSIDRALSLMGFQTVGMLAGSLMLFERMPKGPGAEQVKQAFSHALLSGLLAQELCHSTRHFEGAYLTALFMNLGQMLVEMHFPEDAEALRSAMADWEKAHPDADDSARHEALQRASRQILGLSCEDIGVEVARQWGWPDSLSQSLRRHYPSDPTQAAGPEEYMRMLCTASTELAGRLQALPSGATEEARAEAVTGCLRRFAEGYGGALSLNAEEWPAHGVKSLESWDSLSVVLGFKQAPAKTSKPTRTTKPVLPVDSNFKRGAADRGKQGTAQANSNTTGASTSSSTGKPVAGADKAGAPSPANPSVRPPTEAKSARKPNLVAQERMTSGLSQALASVSQWALAETPFDQVLDQTAQALLDALEAQRVVICLRQASAGALIGRIGKGKRAQAVAACFRVPLQPAQDVFSILCAHGKDTLISDTTDPVVAQRLPAWYRKEVDAGTFLLLPLMLGPQAVGLIYADNAVPDTLHVGEQELTLLKALRNQLVMAMRLRGGRGGTGGAGSNPSA